MRLPAVAIYLLLIKLFVHIECYNTEAIPKSFLRTARSLNPIQAIKKLLPERKVNTRIKLVPAPPGIHPLWKYDKTRGLNIVPVEINDSHPGDLGHLPDKYGPPPTVAIISQPIYPPPNELEPPPTVYDPPYYHQPQPFEPREPSYGTSQSTVSNIPQYEVPASEYGTPQDVYFPVSEYGPPKEPTSNELDIINFNSGEKYDINSGTEMSDGLNVLDTLGPLINFLPDPSSNSNEEGIGSLDGVDIGDLLQIVSSLPKGTIEKLKALLGVYHAKNNQERLKNLFDAKNATLQLKAGALSSFSNFVQDTYKDHNNKTASSVGPFSTGIFSHPLSNGIFNTPSHKHTVNIPFPSVFRSLLSRQNKAPSNLANNILKGFENNHFSHIQGVPIPGLHEDKNSGLVEDVPHRVHSVGNFLRGILFGNNGDNSNIAIESGIYRDIPSDYPGRPGILPMIPVLSGTSRNILVPNLPEPPSLPLIPFVKNVEDIKVPKLPYVYIPKLNSNPRNKRFGPYVSIKIPKPITTYSLPNSNPILTQKKKSSVLDSAGYAVPSQETTTQFYSAPSYSLPVSTPVNSYSNSEKVKFSISQDDANSFQPSSFGLTAISDPVHVASQGTANPMFNEVNSILPTKYEESYNRLDHNNYSPDSYYEPFASYNVENDISVAASEREEQDVEPREEQLSGYSRVVYQNSQGKIASNSSQTPEITDDAVKDQSD